MPIIHQLETGEQYAKIPRAMLDDVRLSLSAKGVLSYLLSKPPKWKMRVSDIVAHCTDGKDAIRTALNQLRAVGYVHYSQARNERGKMSEGVWSICDKPVLSPHTAFPHTAQPDTGNRNHSKIDGSKIDLSQSKGSKGSKESAALPPLPILASPDEIHEAQWRPDTRTKKQKLAAIKPPKDYPDEQHFNAFVEYQQLDGIACKRDNLYRDLCNDKWHKWTGRHWQRIKDWEAFIIALDKRLNSFEP